MTDNSSQPDKRQLLTASAIALAVAGVLLVTVVLPAEYGVDPLGTGRALGLAAMSAHVPVAPPPDTAGSPYIPVPAGPGARYGAAYKTEKTSFTLGPYEYLEYKYHLHKGAGMVFAWRADADVNHDFHGEPDASPGAEATTYEKRPADHYSGALTAPFTGIHGWYWENTGDKPVTITLSSSGFYDHGLEIRANKTRIIHPLTAVP